MCSSSSVGEEKTDIEADGAGSVRLQHGFLSVAPKDSSVPSDLNLGSHFYIFLFQPLIKCHSFYILISSTTGLKIFFIHFFLFSLAIQIHTLTSPWFSSHQPQTDSLLPGQERF